MKYQLPILLILLMCIAPISGCKLSCNADSDVEESIEEVGDSVEDAAEEVGDSIEDATD
ncbi:MAG TPA: hypothetical protein PKN33_09560 [Phycisphaerae bacterium]|nr:hypothetical protein [Phycisphaerales bacterium]HNO78293.1 hypothetical protein [Phycisphaerae bacterium]